MQASAWNNGLNIYGIRVGKSNRDEHFTQSNNTVDIIIDGQLYVFRLTRGFWKDCPEIRDQGSTVLRDWLDRYYTLNWPHYAPPKVALDVLEHHRFKLRPLG